MPTTKVSSNDSPTNTVSSNDVPTTTVSSNDVPTTTVSSNDSPTNTVSSNASSKRCYNNISIGQIVMYSWYLTSLGLPFLTTLYVNKLGESVGLKCLGESGIIIYKNESDVETELDTTAEKKDNKKKHFINDLETAGLFPLATLFGPLSIPLSIGFGAKATINYLRYIS